MEFPIKIKTDIPYFEEYFKALKEVWGDSFKQGYEIHASINFSNKRSGNGIKKDGFFCHHKLDNNVLEIELLIDNSIREYMKNLVKSGRSSQLYARALDIIFHKAIMLCEFNYNHRTTIHAVHFSYNKQSFLLFGKGGSGKSSLIKYLVGVGCEVHSDNYLLLGEKGDLHQFPELFRFHSPVPDHSSLSIKYGNKLIFPSMIASQKGILDKPTKVLLLNGFKLDVSDKGERSKNKSRHFVFDSIMNQHYSLNEFPPNSYFLENLLEDWFYTVREGLRAVFHYSDAFEIIIPNIHSTHYSPFVLDLID